MNLKDAKHYFIIDNDEVVTEVGYSIGADRVYFPRLALSVREECAYATEIDAKVGLRIALEDRIDRAMRALRKMNTVTRER